MLDKMFLTLSTTYFLVGVLHYSRSPFGFGFENLFLTFSTTYIL